MKKIKWYIPLLKWKLGKLKANVKFFQSSNTLLWVINMFNWTC